MKLEEYVMPERREDIAGVPQEAQAVEDQDVVVEVGKAEAQGGRVQQEARQRETGRQLPG